MKYGCIGEHLPHSFSAEIHPLIGDYAYELREVAPEDLDAFLRERDFNGINVTIPYKQTVMPFCEELTERARATDAVNTILRRPDGTLALVLLNRTGAEQAAVVRLDDREAEVTLLPYGADSFLVCP